MENNTEKPKKREFQTIIIPQCCRENWDSCPHKVKRAEKQKHNVGL